MIIMIMVSVEKKTVFIVVAMWTKSMSIFFSSSLLIDDDNVLDGWMFVCISVWNEMEIYMKNKKHESLLYILYIYVHYYWIESRSEFGIVFFLDIIYILVEDMFFFRMLPLSICECISVCMFSAGFAFSLSTYLNNTAYMRFICVNEIEIHKKIESSFFRIYFRWTWNHNKKKITVIDFSDQISLYICEKNQINNRQMVQTTIMKRLPLYKRNRGPRT